MSTPPDGLYVVSDVHGHLADLVQGLAEAGLIDDQGSWTGGDSQLVVLGDLLDRGPHGIGVIRLLRNLQAQAPEQVQVLLGNHEALALGRKRFPGTHFDEVWSVNGGRAGDQDALTDDDVAWLAGLPAMTRRGDFVMMHSDATVYRGWGSTVEEVNAEVTRLLTDGGADECYDVFAALTERYAFADVDGAEVAREFLATFHGECVVHGHSIIGSLLNVPSEQIEGPILYADGLVLAVDGGRYDGGPLLLVRLD